VLDLVFRDGVQVLAELNQIADMEKEIQQQIQEFEELAQWHAETVEMRNSILAAGYLYTSLLQAVSSKDKKSLNDLAGKINGTSGDDGVDFFLYTINRVATGTTPLQASGEGLIKTFQTITFNSVFNASGAKPSFYDACVGVRGYIGKLFRIQMIGANLQTFALLLEKDEKAAAQVVTTLLDNLLAQQKIQNDQSSDLVRALAALQDGPGAKIEMKLRLAHKKTFLWNPNADLPPTDPVGEPMQLLGQNVGPSVQWHVKPTDDTNSTFNLRQAVVPGGRPRKSRPRRCCDLSRTLTTAAGSLCWMTMIRHGPTPEGIPSG